MTYTLNFSRDELKALHMALNYAKTNPYNPVQTERAIDSASAKIEAAQHPREGEKNSLPDERYFITRTTRILKDTGHKQVSFSVWTKTVKAAEFNGSSDARWSLTVEEAEQAAEEFTKEREGRAAR